MPPRMHFVLMLHSHLPYVLNHGRWPHGSDWLCEAALDTYLPLLAKLLRLENAHVDAPLTIGFTPVLANQLEHPAFADELERYVALRLAAVDQTPESLRASGEEHLLPLVGYWRQRLLRMRALFRSLEGRLLDGFRGLQRRERLEITGSAATHAFLPLLARDESIRLQLALGAAEHRRIFGESAEGCWLPECGYRPAGRWQPLPEVRPRPRAGLEHFVAEAGFAYFFVDAHTARAGAPLNLYADRTQQPARRRGARGRVARQRSPYRVYRVRDAEAPSPVSALVRDPRTTAQVWNRHGGYPGDASYLEFHKIRWPGGLRLWRVTAHDVDLGGKAPYEPGLAREVAQNHAVHFLGLLNDIAGGNGQRGDVIVAPFDTELFGHWWHEGPDFIGDVYAMLPNYGSLRAVRATDHVRRVGVFPMVQLDAGSWGKDGDFSMWCNPQTQWTWRAIWELEEAFWTIAPRALGAPTLHPVLAQTARSLLLAQSSDWPFIISTGEAEDYGVQRFTRHVKDCRMLLDALQRALEGDGIDDARQRAATLRGRDAIFPDIIPAIEQALTGTPLAVTRT
jgi:1,4-alpha-glucan branching enzyme